MSVLPVWCQGPTEILQKGFELLNEDNAASTRIAMILVDNSVELMMQTYLTLSKRVTGIDISRRERTDYCSTFPSMLDGIEAHAEEKLIGIDLSNFEWYHRIRNRLYHEGNGLTVSKNDVIIYAELATGLLRALYDVDFDLNVQSDQSAKLIGKFFQIWISIERNISSLADSRNRVQLRKAGIMLVAKGQMRSSDYDLLLEVSAIRNELIHGEAEPDEMLRPVNMTKIESLKASVDEMVSLAILNRNSSS